MATEEEWQAIIDQVNEQLGTSLTLTQQTVYEIVVYAMVKDSENRTYSFLEVSIYTREPISVATVYQCIESNGYNLLRRVEGINRVDVNELKIGRMERQLPEGKELVEDWCDEILKEISTLIFQSPKSGYYYRKRSGISEADYKRQRREKMAARTQRVQERLDRYGLE